MELAATGTVVSTEPGQPTVEEIEDESSENEPDCLMKKIRGGIGVGALQKSAFQNLERGSEPAKKISRRHQIRQEINFGWLFVHLIGEARNNCRSAGDVIAHFHRHPGGERQVYFRS